jgi:hypothetical protein
MQCRILPLLSAKSGYYAVQNRALLNARSGYSAVQNVATLKCRIRLLRRSESCHSLSAKSGYYSVLDPTAIQWRIWQLLISEFFYYSIQNLGTFQFRIWLLSSSKSNYFWVPSLTTIKFTTLSHFGLDNLLLFNVVNCNVLSFILTSRCIHAFYLNTWGLEYTKLFFPLHFSYVYEILALALR